MLKDHFVIKVLSIHPVSIYNILVIKLIGEMWEHGNTAKNKLIGR